MIGMSLDRVLFSIHIPSIFMPFSKGIFTSHPVSFFNFVESNTLLGTSKGRRGRLLITTAFFVGVIVGLLLAAAWDIFFQSQLDKTKRNKRP